MRLLKVNITIHFSLKESEAGFTALEFESHLKNLRDQHTHGTVLTFAQEQTRGPGQESMYSQEVTLQKFCEKRILHFINKPGQPVTFLGEKIDSLAQIIHKNTKKNIKNGNA